MIPQRCETCGGLVRKSSFDQASCRCNKGKVRRSVSFDALPPLSDQEAAEDIEQVLRMEL